MSRKRINVATDETAPRRIWAKLDGATVYMDGSSPLLARTREFTGAQEYVATVSILAGHPDEDDIEEAISGSIDIDWTPRDAAKAVMRLLAGYVNESGQKGESLERTCPFDPNNDPKNENICALRDAFLRGASWRKRNGLSECEGEEYLEKAANDFEASRADRQRRMQLEAF